MFEIYGGKIKIYKYFYKAQKNHNKEEGIILD